MSCCLSIMVANTTGCYLPIVAHQTQKTGQRMLIIVSILLSVNSVVHLLTVSDPVTKGSVQSPGQTPVLYAGVLSSFKA